MERYVRVLVFALLISVFPLLAPGAVAAEPPHISAQAASVIDVQSGRFLYEKNADEQKPIASITKIMTAIIAIEHGDLDEKVTVSARAARQEVSSLYLKS
jgi:serine-type D-Ala-D-Ala carboxypeptidase (penicillin-binding protein 5/6)